jgi:hypothetical protein
MEPDPDGDEGFGRGGWFRRFDGNDLDEWGKAALDEALGAEAWPLGRRSYGLFGSQWRSRTGALANRLNDVPEYVVSSILGDPEWANTTVLTGDAATEVARLKHELDGGPVTKSGTKRLSHRSPDESRGSPPTGYVVDKPARRRAQAPPTRHHQIKSTGQPTRVALRTPGLR